MPNDVFNILITGSNGQLGSEIRELEESYSYNFFFTDRASIDITSKDSIRNFCESNNVNTIINCAAYTAVDKAEADVESADLINRKVVEKLAIVSKELNIKLIHVSTDYVFDGENYKPYVESDITNPQSVYGETKLAGDDAMLKVNPRNSIIIRTSWVYSGFGSNFVKTMLRLGKERDSLGVIFDQVGTPTYARDLAIAILDILPKISNAEVEIYHYSNEGVASWYDFAKEIMDIAQINCIVNPIETTDYPTPAKRPHYSLLNKKKIKDSYGIDISYWKDSLKDCLKNYKRIYKMSYKAKNILVTGAAGFIGSNYVRMMLTRYDDVKIVSYDKLTYAGSLENLKGLHNESNHTFVKGDICDEKQVYETLKEHNIDTIVHFAAESHVDNSIANPKVFLETNVIGTFNLLNQAKRYWLDEKGLDETNCKFHHVSTDEVYGTLEKDDPAFTEDKAYEPNSPYSASKAGSDHIVRAYLHTYKLPVTISNCSNNYGPYQHPEKLIPVVIGSCINQKSIPVYGDGSNIRDWLYVEDHCDAIQTVVEKGVIGEVYNVGGINEVDNLTLINIICKLMDGYKPKNAPHSDLITFVEDRKGHDWRYAIDNSKIQNDLGWKPSQDFEKMFKQTIEFYIGKSI